MGDGYIELDPMSAGDKIDAETVTVDSTPVLRERVRQAGELEVELAEVKAAAIPNDAYALGVRSVVARSTITTLQNGVTLNATQDNQSASQDCSAYRKANIWLSVVRSASPPSKLTIRPQYTPDSGSTWHIAEEQVREITDMGLIPTSGGYRICYEIVLLGPDFRLEIEGDTDATNTFTVTTKVEFKD